MKNLPQIFSGIQKFTVTDYPGNLAATFFTCGCNFRCSYCHNPNLVEAAQCEFMANEEVFSFLKKRKNNLQGIVLCGGEPTIHKSLPAWIKYIKSFGYNVKLDTNGTNPKMLRELIEQKLINYVAMDYKAPIDNYENVVDSKLNKNSLLESLQILIELDINYEIRSTIHGKLHSHKDVEKMIDELQKIGIENYFLQAFDSPKAGTVGNIENDYFNRQIIRDSKVKLEDSFKKCGLRNLYDKSSEN
jgi:pyruvate formate lyase activating enzyme